METLKKGMIEFRNYQNMIYLMVKYPDKQIHEIVNETYDGNVTKEELETWEFYPRLTKIYLYGHTLYTTLESVEKQIYKDIMEVYEKKKKSNKTIASLYENMKTLAKEELKKMYEQKEANVKKLAMLIQIQVACENYLEGRSVWKS